MRKVPDCSTTFHESLRRTAALPLAVVIVCSCLHLDEQSGRFVGVCYGRFRLSRELVVDVLVSGLRTCLVECTISISNLQFHIVAFCAYQICILYCFSRNQTTMQKPYKGE